MGKSTAQIVRDYNQGHDREESARLLFKRYYGSIYGFLRRKGFPNEECEELTEDVFFSVFSKLKEIRDESRFEYWMFMIARNVYRNELERRGAKKRTGVVVPLKVERGDAEGVELPSAETGSPEAQVLRKEKLEQVRRSLAQLPTQMRRCLFLRVDDGLTYREIASVMQISINTVSAHIHQARKVLREKLRPYFSEVEF